MVRHYKKKEVLRQWSPEDLENALDGIKSGKLSIRAAAKTYNIPRSTISDYLRGKSTVGCALGRPPALPSKVEDNLVSKAMEAADKGLGVSRLQMMTKAGMSIGEKPTNKNKIIYNCK